jgi:hypothetical protein
MIDHNIPDALIEGGFLYAWLKRYIGGNGIVAPIVVVPTPGY